FESSRSSRFCLSSSLTVFHSRFATTWRLASARFWLIVTKVERKIASSETIIVSSPNGYFLNAEPDPAAEPNDVDVDEPHRAGEGRDLVRDPVLDALGALLGVLEERGGSSPGR